MNRRGNLFDAIPIIQLIIPIVVLLFVGIVIVNQLSTAFNGTVPSVASDMSTSIDNQAGWTFDFIFVMLLFTLPLGSAILAYFVNIPPFFFFASFGIIMLIVLLANSFGDSYVSFSTSSSTMLAVANRLPMTNYIMSHFVIYSMVSVGVIMFGVFMKPKRNS